MCANLRWLPVVGFEGLYEVCEDGRVRSLPRQTRVRGNGIRTLPIREIRPYKMKKIGHLAIDLVPLEGRQFRRRTRVHTVVLEAFVGPRPEGYAACHNDGDPQNNHISNLRWDSYSSNNYDMVRHGRHHMAVRTLCDHGHPLDGRYSRQRYCKTCHNESSREYKAKQRGFASHEDSVAQRETKRKERLHFSRQLSDLMRQRGITQVGAATRLGTSQANVWRWMNAKAAPPKARRAEILDALRR